MPKLADDGNMSTFQTPVAYKFSGVNIEDLKASEYTLVTIVQDKSGSVHPFMMEMIDCLKTILGACQSDPRSDNQMVRLVSFNDYVDEFHGFRFLNDIDPDEYDLVFKSIGGSTALFDSTHSAIDASFAYGEKMADQGVQVNAIVFVITDGDDNASKFDASQIKDLIRKSRQEEKIESILTILVGITDNRKYIQDYLDNFKKEAELDEFIDIGSATKSSLSKLAKFVSQSISSQSQALGSGGPSKLLSF